VPDRAQAPGWSHSRVSRRGGSKLRDRGLHSTRLRLAARASELRRAERKTRSRVAIRSAGALMRTMSCPRSMRATSAAPTRRLSTDRIMATELAIEFDANGEQVRGQRGGGTQAEPTPRLADAEQSLTFPRVVVIEDVRRSRPPRGGPPASRLHTDASVRLDVTHPNCVATALGKQPERIALQPVANRREPRRAGAPPRRLEQGVSGIREPETEHEPDQRVHDRPLQRMHACHLLTSALAAGLRAEPRSASRASGASANRSASVPRRRTGAPDGATGPPHGRALGSIGRIGRRDPRPPSRSDQDLRKASRSALIVSACVVGQPCGNPL
jgi:hypothetical protein